VSHGFDPFSYLDIGLNQDNPQIRTEMLLIITGIGHELFSSMTYNTREPPKSRVLMFLCDFRLRCTLQRWIASKWLHVDQDNLRTETAKAVARLMSFSQITCYMQAAVAAALRRQVRSQTGLWRRSRTVASLTTPVQSPATSTHRSVHPFCSKVTPASFLQKVGALK